MQISSPITHKQTRFRPAPDQALPSGDEVLARIEDRFDLWDRDQNGQISWSEMRANVADPRVKGDDALSLASFYSLVEMDAQFRGLEQRAPVPFDKIWELSVEYDTDGEAPVLEQYYHKYHKKLSEASTDLFPDNMPAALLGKQGAGPSCGFLATTFGQVTQDPQSLKQAISPTSDGKYDVQFPGLEKAISIIPPTDTETALFATAGSNGTWLNTLEKAWGTHLQGRTKNAAFEQTTYPEDAIRAWTDGDAITARVPKNPKAFKKGEIPGFLRTVKRELDQEHLVVAWTRYEGIRGEHFVPGHAYTVTDIDQEAGTISLRNPWGRLEPKNDKGETADGVDDGVFDYPLQEFHHKFAQIARQTA